MRSPTHATFAILSLAVLAIGPVQPASAESGASVRIAELLANPDATQGQREFIEVWNPTTTAIDLTGWALRDAATASGATNEFTFTSGNLAAGGRIVVWSNGTGDARGPSWSTSASKTVWNDAGDAATLLDPQGTVIDWLAYGNSAATAPTGFEGQARPAAPARGLSLALDGTTWKSGAPTPALAPGAVGGVATATVLNVAPDARLTGVPAAAKPGEAVSIGLAVEDGNGAADLADWTLAAGGAILASGTGTPTATVDLVAPAFSGPWTISLTVADQAGLMDVASATVQVRDARLSVSLPSGALRFPDLRPGDASVAATDWATLRNEGADAVLPLLDVSPFAGVGGEIPVDGNLEVGVRAVGGNATWVAYEGPLTPLPAVAPGASFELSLRLLAVPAPLAAGAYGTTFAVVAA
ncbi:MAG: lamin tail domain-containing protein [Thermoplasmatota archaeon]